MKPLSFRLKIALLSAGISGLVLLTFGGAAWVIVSRQKLASLDTEIGSLGARHPGWIATQGNYQRLDDALAFIFGEAHQDEIILLLKGGRAPCCIPPAAGRAGPPGVDGIGLGLSLAREIVRAHGGELALKESRAGRTCFELRLNRHA